MSDSAAHEALLWNGINAPYPVPDAFRTTCPKCSATRQKSREKCLRIWVEPDNVRWLCMHCDWDGGEFFSVAA
jgi:hypothetical protein